MDRFHSIHWDTADLRLAQWEAGLRYRRGRGWRATLASYMVAGVAHQVEMDFDGPQETPPPEAVRLLDGYLRGAPLRPAGVVRHLESRRQMGDVCLVHQVVSRIENRHAVQGARRLSLRSAAEPGERRLLAALRRAGIIDPSPLPLVSELFGEEARPLWRVEGLEATSSVAATVSSALRDFTARLIRNQPLLLEGSDPEGVHQARVACRRLGSALQTFSTVVDTGWSEPLRADLTSLTDALGAVRDTEVLLMRLRGSAARVPGLDAATAERLLGQLETQRTEAREELVRRVSSPDHRAHLERLIAAATRPWVLADTAERPAVEILSPLVEASWRKLRRQVGRVGAQPDDRGLHRVRILAKRCRYAVLAVAPVAGEAPARTAVILGELQDALGEQHDAVVAGEWLRRAADPETSFVAGILYARERELAERGRTAWRGPWRSLVKKERWRWL
ncbi:MAG: CHAD domain-containing protein [Candidatus Dormibacteria bacterium]